MLVTTTRIALDEPQGVLTPLSAHLVEHDAVVAEHGDATVITLEASRATLRAATGVLEVAVEASDLASLQAMKLAVSSHVVEFAPVGVVIAWRGDGAGPALPPDFRVLTVTGTEQITPHMRRIHFRGEDLGRFDSLEALHVRLFIPPVGLAEPAWPLIGEDGLLRHPPLERRAAIRKYTIREIDVAAGMLAVDFVMHDDAGPGSAFASRAGAGDTIGMAGPGGRGLRTAGRYIFLADETGLPAVARMLAHLPADAEGMALIEVADEREQQTLRAPAGVSIRWLHRGVLPAGSSRLLQDAFAALNWTSDAPETFLWAATEHQAFRHVRAMARERLRAGQDQHLIVSYWRSGISEDQHASEKRAAAEAA